MNAKSKKDTEELWKHLYANEPYDLDSARALSEDVHAKAEKYSDYDLVSAVSRQSPFFYQVSRRRLRLFFCVYRNISAVRLVQFTNFCFVYLNAKFENQ